MLMLMMDKLVDRKQRLMTAMKGKSMPAVDDMSAFQRMGNQVKVVKRGK